MSLLHQRGDFHTSHRNPWDAEGLSGDHGELYWGYLGIMAIWENGKENGNYCNVYIWVYRGNIGVIYGGPHRNCMGIIFKNSQQHEEAAKALA